MEDITPINWVIENWEIVFIYAFKQLNDIKTTIAVHNTEIENLKKA